MAALGGSLSGWLGLPVVAFAISAISTAFAIRYAKRRRLIDQPGARRSHSQPTPRGGGVGIVVAVLLCVCVPGLLQASPIPALTLGAAVLIVAAVGWIDDHRGLHARTRFVAHCIAALIVLLPAAASLLALSLDVGQLVSSSFVVAWLGLIALAFAIVWSINLHNFMDGIDGILASQALFVFAVLAWLCTREENIPHGLQIALWAAAVAAFLPFNFPRARIFMGDVGSGTLGLMIFIASAWQFSGFRSAHVSAVIVSSAFLTDATCTLLSRVARGKRWYRPHREHLYQAMARTGMPHAAVVAWYSAWNILVVLPIIVALNGEWVTLEPSAQWIFVSCFYTVAVIVWICGKRWCLYKVKNAAIAANA